MGERQHWRHVRGTWLDRAADDDKGLDLTNKIRNGRLQFLAQPILKRALKVDTFWCHL